MSKAELPPSGVPDMEGPGSAPHHGNVVLSVVVCREGTLRIQMDEELGNHVYLLVDAPTAQRFANQLRALALRMTKTRKDAPAAPR